MKKSLSYSLITIPFIFLALPSYSLNNTLSDETTLKMIVTGKYDKKTKTIVHRLSQTITKKFEMLNNEEYKTSIVLNKSFTQNGKLKQIIVTQSKDKTSECHGCAPIVGISTLTKTNNNWSVENKIDYIARIGTWGKTPKPKLLEIGKDNYGLIFEEGYTGMGMTTTRTYITAKINDKYKPVLTVDNTYTDNAGICGEETKQLCYKYDSTYKFVKDNQKFYPIVFTYKGTDTDGNEKVISANKTIKYIFSKDQYILQK